MDNNKLFLNNLKPVSVIITVKNEADQIKPLLDSLFSQTYKPYEIIIVDGGSSDGTAEIVRKYVDQGAQIRLIISPGSNIAQGRNIGISNSLTDYIACTDAGVVPDRNWLANLMRRFDGKTDVVSGVYLPLCNSTFQECIAELLCPRIEDLNDSFLPSSRSIAFKKSAWVEVGGYPEDIKYAEDTLFDIKLKEKGYKFTLAKDAVVYWKLRTNLASLFLQYFWYAYYETKSGLIFRLSKYRSSQIIQPTIRYFNSIWRICKTQGYRFGMVSLLILLTFYLSTFCGFILGFVTRVLLHK